jgi:hypothetical protein
MSAARDKGLKERLTACSLILPVLNFSALLVGLGLLIARGMLITDPVCFALAQG